MPKTTIGHGARLKVVFEGKIIGTITSLTFNEDVGQQAVYGIGNFLPQEIVSLRFTGTFNYNSLVIVNAKITDLQYAERSGKSIGEIARAILTQEGFTITIEDKIKGDLLASIGGVKMGNLSFNFGENVLVQKSGSGLFANPVSAP